MQAVPIELLAIKYNENKKAIKSLDEENKKIREPLEDYLRNKGVIPNETSGHKMCDLSYADVDIRLKYTHKVTAVLQPDAVDILKRNKLESAVETVEVVREDVIERLYDEGKISDDLMKELYVSKESNAFSVEVTKKNALRNDE